MNASIYADCSDRTQSLARLLAPFVAARGAQNESDVSLLTALRAALDTVSATDWRAEHSALSDVCDALCCVLT